MAESESLRRAHLVRVVAIAICGAGIAGMIATSIADSTTGAMAFGLTTAVAGLVMTIAGYVAKGSVANVPAEALASQLEASITTLGRHGHDAAVARRVARIAFELGRRETP